MVFPFPTALMLSQKLAVGFQRQLFWGLAFLVQVPRAGVPNVGLEPLTSQRGAACFVISLPLVDR